MIIIVISIILLTKVSKEIFQKFFRVHLHSSPLKECSPSVGTPAWWVSKVSRRGYAGLDQGLRAFPEWGV
jgi:hypothetical protein